jgi:multiple sugar transport system ATP-binding protein
MNFLPGVLKANGRLAFQQEGSNVTIPIPEALSGKFRQYAGPAVTLGIRPEHLYASRPPAAESIAPVPAHVEVVEPVGNEIFVYFSTGTPAQFVARVATENPPQVGKPCELYVDTSKLHFFDSRSDAAL